MATKAADIRNLIAALADQGFTIVQRKGNGHYGVYRDGEHVTDLAKTPSVRRGTLNAHAALRRHGFIDPAREARKRKGDRRA